MMSEVHLAWLTIVVNTFEILHLTAPLRELTKKHVRFEWTQKHQAAFEKLKTTLATAPCMSYFDKTKETFVVVDASPVGISAFLSQIPRTCDTTNQQIIAYAIQSSINGTEKRYSQTEKEALAIVWAVEHFHLFLFGSETDHKPLEIIYGQRTAKTSAHIERWVLRLQPYAFKIIYKSGAKDPADYLSRIAEGSGRAIVSSVSDEILLNLESFQMDLESRKSTKDIYHKYKL